MASKMQILVAIFAIAVFISGCTAPAEDTTGSEVSSGNESTAAGSDSGNVKTFVLTGEDYRFLMDGEEAPVLRVKEGDTVRIEFTSTDGFHDWVVDEFNAATEQVNTGGSSSVEFVADKKGSYEYYCSVGSHREMGMRGTLIVE